MSAVSLRDDAPRVMPSNPLFTLQNTIEELNLFLRQWEKDFPSFHAQLWAYKLTHKVIQIRLQSDTSGHNIHIQSWMTEHFEGPLNWQNPNFEFIALPGETQFAIREEKSNALVNCRGVGIQMNVEPVYGQLLES
jgi:hypothetical protein